MTDRTCLEAECTRRRVARGLCQKHYVRRTKAGTLPPRGVDRPTHHLMSDVDLAGRTATCSICGPTTIRVRVGRRGAAVCKRAEKRKVRSKNAVATRNNGRLKRNGWTVAERDRQSEEQGGRCAICGLEKPLVCDHDHQTGFKRQLLCHACNVALGFLRDDPDVADAAASYLRRHAA